MIVKQKHIKLSSYGRGCHLITAEISTQLNVELAEVKVGLLNLFLLHTSASLSLNENADPDVRSDLELAMNTIVPENLPFRHTSEGTDDMPAHVKSSLFGASLLLPVSEGQMTLGTWQGIYLFEHRDGRFKRKILATLLGS